MPAFRPLLRSRPAEVALMAAALTLLTWSGSGYQPAPGLDPSWQGALHMAWRDGLNFGEDILYTYGPYGFLHAVAFWEDGTGLAALAYSFASRFLFLGVLYLGLRRTFPLWAAALIAFVVAQIVSDISQALALAAATIGVVALTSTPGRRALTALAVVGGAATGFALLTKTNAGVATAIAVGITILALPERKRTIPLALAAAAATFLVLWLLAGQSLAALPDFAIGALRISSGFSYAMQIESGGLEWHYPAALLLSGGLAALLWQAGSTVAFDRRLGLLALGLLYGWVQFKSGFVRHDPGHATTFFAALLVLACAIPLAGRRGVALATIGATAVAALGASGTSWRSLTDPGDSVDAAFDSLALLVDGDEREERREAGRDAILAAEALTTRTREAIGDKRAHIWPMEAAIAWAEDLNWEPLPVFQNYQAYLPGLDRMNADELADPEGPEVVVVTSNDSGDGRHAGWDTPQATQELLCRFAPLVRDSKVIVVQRTGAACPAPELVGSVYAAWGQAVGVPDPTGPDKLVTVRIAGASARGFERLRGLLHKGRIRTLTVPGRDFKLTAEVADRGLPVRAGRLVDFDTGPLAQVPQVEALTLTREDQPEGGTPLRYDFYETTVSR